LIHDHAEETGCEIVPDLVESVDRDDDVRRTASAEPTGASSSGDGDGFVVELQEGGAVTARRVVAATRYDGEYMRGLDDESAMFEEYEHDGETHETFDSEYADHDGTTAVEGLYVASPSTEADRQAIMAAGRGARVGLRVVEDVRSRVPADGERRSLALVNGRYNPENRDGWVVYDPNSKVQNPWGKNSIAT
jgi:thioredoxin reductase